MRIEEHLRHMPGPDFKHKLKEELLSSILHVTVDTAEVRRIGIVADTHCDAARPLPATVLTALAGSELIIHCGDITALSVLDQLEIIAPVLAVRGDTDHDHDPRIADRARVIEAGGFRIGVTFNFKLPQPPSTDRERAKVRQVIQDTFAGQVDMVVSAATHIGLLQRWSGTWFLNPGSPTLPANGRKSIGSIEIDDELRPHLIEL